MNIIIQPDRHDMLSSSSGERGSTTGDGARERGGSESTGGGDSGESGGRGRWGRKQHQAKEAAGESCSGGGTNAAGREEAVMLGGEGGRQIIPRDLDYLGILSTSNS